MKAFVDRFRARAAEVLDDAPIVEDLLEKAGERARRSERLREDLAPLKRMVRSYVRGSYREDPGEVVWALTAVIYVASPFDLVPDYLPGGLKDDETVVRWVRERIAEALGRYEAWERTVGEEPDAIEPQSQTPAPEPLALDVGVLDRPDWSLFARVDAPATPAACPVALNPALVGGAQMHAALQAGQVVRVVGPPEALRGLADGTLEMIPSGAGHLGTVRGVGVPGFKHQLRFSDPQAQNVAAPALAAFQVASAVTLQYYLARIDRQLGDIDRAVRGTRQDIRDERYGRIETARRRCATVEQVLAELGEVAAHDLTRLDLAAHDLEQTYNALRASVEAFCDRVDATVETASKDELEDLLQHGSGVGLTDAQLLLFAAVVLHRIHGLRAFLLARDSEGRGQLALAEAQSEHEAMTAVLSRVRASFRRLHVPKRRLDERWEVLGGPEKALRDYSVATTDLRASLTAPDEALPALVPDLPFVMDLRLGDGGQLEVEWARVREAPVTAAAR